MFSTLDLLDLTASVSSKLKRCHENHEAWKLLTGDTGAVPLSDLDRRMRANSIHSSCVFSSVSDALYCVLAEREPLLTGLEHQRLPCVLPHSDHVQVVITGSLHLVGAAMKVLGRDIVNV